MKVFVQKNPATPYWCALWLTVAVSIVLWGQALQRQRMAGDRWAVGSDGCSLAIGDSTPMECVSSSPPIDPIWEVILPTFAVGASLFFFALAGTVVMDRIHRIRFQSKEKTVLS